jgi:hypothetical protein
MWYILLLEQLAASPESSFDKRAVLFIKTLIESVKSKVLDGDEFEPQFIFGLLSDIYSGSQQPEFLEASFSKFAQFCLGLAILHAKSSEDESIFCVDFIDVLNNPLIYTMLNLDHELTSFQLKSWNEYQKGKQVYKSIVPQTSIKDINQYITNRKNFISAIQTDLLKQFECKAFSGLSYQVRVDVDQLVSVLNVLLNQIEDPSPVLKGLHEHIQGFKNIDDKFDLLIEAISGEINRLEQSNLKSIPLIVQKPVNKAHKYKYSRLSDEDSESDVGAENFDELTSKTKVCLALIPKIPIQTPVIPDTNLKPAIQQLKNYVHPPANLYSFFVSTQRNHISEINVILHQVNTGQIATFASILEELHKIKIAHPKDVLLSVISYLEKKCSPSSNTAHI